MFDRGNSSQAGGNTAPRPLPPMPPDSREQSAPPLLAILGAEARIEGTFDIAESIQIECEVGGELNVGGRLVIGARGIVRANVRTVDAVIRGQFEGRLIASGDVEITETGRVSGNIQTDSLVISKGGSFNGNVVKMTGALALHVPPGAERQSVDRQTPDRSVAAKPGFGRYEPPSADNGADADDGFASEQAAVTDASVVREPAPQSNRHESGARSNDYGRRNGQKQADRRDRREHGRDARNTPLSDSPPAADNFDD